MCEAEFPKAATDAMKEIDEPARQPKVYLIIIQFGDADDFAKRIRESTPQIKAVITKFCGVEHEVVFTSPDGSTFGVLIKTAKAIQIIRQALLGKSDYDYQTSALLNRDKFIAFEIGKDCDPLDFWKVRQWLEKHNF